MKREYIDVYQKVEINDWEDLHSLATVLVRSGYDLKLTAKRTVNIRHEFDFVYTLEFRNRDFDYMQFRVADDYRSEEVDGVENVYVRQQMSFTGSDNALIAAKTLIHNNYEVAVWTDRETFGDEYPKYYAVEFVNILEGVGIGEKWL